MKYDTPIQISIVCQALECACQLLTFVSSIQLKFSKQAKIFAKTFYMRPSMNTVECEHVSVIAV